METYDDLYKTVCRVCLSYGNKENMVCLIDNHSEDGLSCFGKAVVMFAKVLINVEDDLPKCLCGNCVKILKYAIYFKLKCESSDKRLRNLSKIHHKSEYNLKEAIVDYLMFKQYFPEGSYSKDSKIDLNRKLEDLSADNEVKYTEDLDNSCFEIDNFENYSQAGSDKDSADEELEALEKLITQPNSTIRNISYKPRVRRKVLKHSKVQARLITTQNKTHRKNLIKQSENGKFTCKICQKELANQHTYKYHMERHTGCKFICEHCGKGFPVLVELNMHQVARHGTGPFLQCPHCAYKAPRKLNLVEHIRIHTGERPYTCDKCGLTFRRSAIWKKHMVYHTEKTVQCPHCPRKFFRRSEMQAHANSIHERMYIYLCHKCDATYAKTETVRRHLLERHGIPREMQGKIVRINKGRGTEFPEQ